jgi:hypothetical protein
MSCRERELLEALRYVVANPGDIERARRLLESIDEDEEAVRREQDPYGEGVPGCNS